MATATKGKKKVATNSAIEKIEAHVQQIKSGTHPTVRPGMTVVLNEAASVNDCVRQGDLYVIVVEKGAPEDYVPANMQERDQRQLVLGNTNGAKHCLENLNGVNIFVPKDWNDNSLWGPYVEVTGNAPAKILHPTHGPVVVAPGLCIRMRYQREWDREQKERRNRD
jgi:hypothetical protein